MASNVLLLLFVFACLAGTITYADQCVVESQYTMNSMAELLKIPPYRVFSDYAKPLNLDPSIDAMFQNLANQYNMKVSDLYQFYDMIMNSVNVNAQQAASMISQLASAYSSERDRLLNSLKQQTGVPLMSKPLSPPRFMNSFLPRTLLPRLSKREPAPAGLLGSMINDASSNMRAAYDNVMNFVTEMAPETTQAMKNVVNDIVGTSVPAAMEAESRQLSNQLSSNMRYMMAQATNAIKSML